MNYIDIIDPDYIDDYQNYHKIIYRALRDMIFDYCFVNNGFMVSKLYDGLNPDLTLQAHIYHDVFSLLVMKTYKAFFDKSGHGENSATNIFTFKGQVWGKYIKPEYKNVVLDMTKSCKLLSSDYRDKRKKIEADISGMRSRVMAHNLLLQKPEEYTVYLPDIKELLDNGIELFHVLSFGPFDFYDHSYEDGYDFSDEYKFADESSQRFWEIFYVSSKYIKAVDWSVDENALKNIGAKDIEQNVLSKLQALRSSINLEKFSNTVGH